MYLNLGAKIKELRLKNDQTQETLANYFGITIDKLFCYNNRDTIVKKIIDKVNSFNIKAISYSNLIDECLQILREELAELAKNEDLLITLIETLCEASYRKFNKHLIS